MSLSFTIFADMGCVNLFATAFKSHFGMDKLFYTIGEVADALGESTSLVRFWTNRYAKYIRPHRNSKGNRLYNSADVELLKQLHFLIKDQGLTLDGAEKELKANKKGAVSKLKAINALKSIKAQLQEIRKML